MSHSERLVYFKNIKADEFKLIDEIILNFLQKNIKTKPESMYELKKIKDFLRAFIKVKTRSKRKKALLLSLRGLRMVALVFPLVNFILQNV